MIPKATVIISTFGRADFVRWAIASVQRQTITNLEIYVVCDGSDISTLSMLSELASSDGRIKIFDNPKGLSIGEEHRHRAIKEGTGDIVCYLGHDDIWLPKHVETMQRLLGGENDFVSSLFTAVLPSGDIWSLLSNLESQLFRERLLHHRWNCFGPTSVAHTRALYDRLPYGYRPAPGHMWSDLYMWRQILEVSDIRAISYPHTTAVSFPNSCRRGFSIEERDSEIERYFEKLMAPGADEMLTLRSIQAAGRALFEDYVHAESAAFDKYRNLSPNLTPRPSSLSLLLGELLLVVQNISPRRLCRLKESLSSLIVASSGLFDEEFYCRFCTDAPQRNRVRVSRDSSDISPAQHFIKQGARDGYHPSARFDVSHYLVAHPDVFSSGLNPLLHYICHGFKEAREARAVYNPQGVK